MRNPFKKPTTLEVLQVLLLGHLADDIREHDPTDPSDAADLAYIKRQEEVVIHAKKISDLRNLITARYDDDLQWFLSDLQNALD